MSIITLIPCSAKEYALEFTEEQPSLSVLVSGMIGERAGHEEGVVIKNRCQLSFARLTVKFLFKRSPE
jgi:hypothetical protein